MAESFDPYLQWLGIRDPERPPNHYRLLGVDPLESDPQVLTHAADRQMAHLRTFQMGKHSAESQKLLNEVAAAKLCLLNPAKKAEYDAQLTAKTKGSLRGNEDKSPPIDGHSGEAEADASNRDTPPKTPVDQPPPLPPAAAEPLRTDTVAITREPAARSVSASEGSPVVSCAITVLGATAVALIGLIVLFSMGRWWDEPPDPTATGSTTTEPVQPPQDPGTSQPEHPEPGPPRPDAPGPNPPQPDVPGPEAPQPDAPEPDAPQRDTPSPDPPQPDTPGPDTPKPPVDHRMAIPTPADRVRVTEEVRDLFEEEYAEAKARAQIRGLAQMLSQKALETTDNPVARYVLLTEACNRSIAAGDSQLFRSTVQRIGREYAEDWLETAADTLYGEAQKTHDAEAGKAMAKTAMELTRTAIVRGDLELATRLAKAGRDMARSPKIMERDLDLIKQAAARMNEVAVLRQRHADFLAAEKVLAERPDDPQANLTVGRYLCLVEGNFDRGLPSLLKSGDPLLAALAEAETARPKIAEELGPAEMAALGHGWWEASAKIEEIHRRSARSRAVHWYQKALPGLSGLTRTKIERRLAEFRGG